MAAVTSKIVHERIKIYINGLIHISIPIDPNTKIQSWRDAECNYKIEIWCAGHTDTYAYINFQLWEGILKELDKYI